MEKLGDYSVKATLSAVDKNFSSTMKGAVGYADNLKDTLMSGLGFGVLTGIGQAAFSAVSSGLSGLMGEAVETSDAMQKLQQAMRFSGSSEAEIERIAGATGTLKTYADKTVFSLQDVMSTFGALSANGIADADKMTEAVGNAVAVFGGGANEFSSVALAFSQSMAAGKMNAQDWNQVLNASPQLAGGLKKELQRLNPVLEKDFKGAMEKGAITAELLGQAMTNIGMTDMAQEAAQSVTTFEGAMGNLEATVSSGLLTLYDSFAKSGLIDVINSLNTSIGSGFTWLSESLPVLIEKASPYLEILGDGISEVKDAFGDSIGLIVEDVGELTGAFGSAESIDGFGDIVSGAVDALTGLSDFLGEHSDIIAKVLVALPKLLIAYKGFKVVSAVAPFVSTFSKGIVGLAGKGIGAIAGKLFGIAAAEQATGTASMTSSTQVTQMAVAFLALGAGVALASAGLAIIAYSAIQLAQAGPLAIATTLGLVAVMALLAVGAAALGPALTAGAVGFIAFGGAIALVGVGALAAGTALMLVSMALPAIIEYGIQGTGVLTLFSLGLIAFAAGALLAGAGCIVLGAGLALVAVGLAAVGVAVAILAVGILALSAGALITAASLALLSLVLPAIAEHGTTGALAILELGAALLAFSIGAGVAAIAVMAFGAGLTLAAVGILLCAAGVILLAAGILVIGTFALAAAVGMSTMAAVLPILTSNSVQNAAALVVLAGGLTALGVAAGVAGAGATALGVGLAAVAVGIAAVGIAIAVLAAGVLLLSVSAMVAAGSIALLSLVIPLITANSQEGATALISLGAGLTTFAAGAVLAGAAAFVLGAGIAVFGASMLVAVAGVVAMEIGLLAVSSSMETIAKNAKNAEKSITNMTGAVDVINEGLDALKDKAKDAVDKLVDTFSDGTGDAKAAALGLMKGVNLGIQTGSASTLATITALMAGMVVATNATYGSLYSAGNYIGQGLAAGLWSSHAQVAAAAAALAAEADKAVRAKAKIKSPSRVAMGLGEYWGEGYAIGIESMGALVRDAGEELVQIPDIPTFSDSYGNLYADSSECELDSDHSYHPNGKYTIIVPVQYDGRELARVEAEYMQEELEKLERINNRKKGYR